MGKLKTFGIILKTRALAIGLATAIAALYLYRLGSLPTDALAPDESSTLAASSSLHAVIYSPLFLPLHILRWLTTNAVPSHLNAAARFPSVLLVLLTIASLVYIVQRWYKQRTMYFAIAIIVTSAWMLHIGRLATDDVAYLAAIPILLASQLLLHDYTERKPVIFISVAVFASMLYVPGLIWFVVTSIIWQRVILREALRGLKWPQLLLLAVMTLIIVTPLIYGTVQNLHLSYALTWLGLPTTLPSWQEPLKNLAAALAFVFVRTPEDPTRWLGTLPLLDAFLGISFIAGIIFYMQHVRAERTRLLLLFGIVGLVLCAAGGAVTRSILVPLVYLVAIGGIAYILHQWLHVFPRNPLARRFGIGLICVAVILSCAYNLRHYFVAWPHHETTIETFSTEG